MRMILPVILSGGAGTRLWPVSLPERPKQLQQIVGTRTMLQDTAWRVADLSLFARPLVIASERHVGEIAAQLGATGVPPALLILEPVSRNTAAATALAALACRPDDLMLVLPSDHVIKDIAAFHAAVRAAEPLAVDGWLVTFGIRPTRAETGYGYIKRGGPLSPGAFAAERFVEKPDVATAELYLADGGFDWNGGIFLMRADRYLEELALHAPDVLEPVRIAMDRAHSEDGRILPDAAAFATARAQSIDYAVMERAGRVAVVPVEMGWSDVGSWDALYELAERDERGVARYGNVLAIDSVGCLVRSDGPTVVTIGISDLIVVATANAVLILPRGQSQRVKDAVQALERQRSEK